MSDTNHGLPRPPIVNQLDASIAQGVLSEKHRPGADSSLRATSGR